MPQITKYLKPYIAHYCTLCPNSTHQRLLSRNMTILRLYLCIVLFN